MRGGLNLDIDNFRIAYVDIAKGIAIYLVVLGHIVYSNSTEKQIIYSFHMPLFFILSGFFIRERKVNIEFCKKKLYQLMLPFFFWGVIYMKLSIKNVALLLYGSMNSIIDAGSLSSLWFLPVLFISNLIAYTICIYKNGLIKYLFIVVLFVLGYNIPFSLPWGLNIAFIGASYMLIGKVIFELTEVIKRKMLISVLLFGCFILFSFTVHYSSSPIGYMRMADSNYGPWYIFFINSILGSLCVILLSKLLGDFSILKRTIGEIGKYTLGIFLIHKFFVSILNYFQIGNANIVFLMLVSILIIVSAYFITIFLNVRIPQLFGK